MEVNKDEALRALAIARKHRDAGNDSSALKFVQKSLSLFSTVEAEKLLADIQARPSSSSSNSTGKNGSNGGASTVRASGAETHAADAKQRHTNGHTGGGMGGDNEKRESTPEQRAIVKRVRACKTNDFYGILAVKKECDEADVKKAYRKLALALHPDKNGAPGADEAFKLVSKAFQILSDPQKRTIYDQSGGDPDSRFGGGGGGHPGFATSPFGNGGGMQFEGELNPEDLFNMFFGGGGGFGGGPFGGGGFRGGPTVFTTTFGPGGFRTTRTGAGGQRAQQHQQGGEPTETRSILMQLLPLLILFGFSFLSAIPSLFGVTPTPDPRFSFSKSGRYDVERTTGGMGIRYHVNGPEFARHAQIAADVAVAAREGGRRGEALKRFEGNVEKAYTEDLYIQCRHGMQWKERRKEEEVGLFGFGTDWEKVKQIEEEKVDSCEELRRLGVIR